MVKRGPKVDSDYVLEKKIRKVFENFPDGLSVRDAIKKIKEAGILASPNRVLSLLRELYEKGVLEYRLVKKGRGPIRKVYYLSSIARTSPDLSKIEEIFDMRKKVLSLGILPLISELQSSPAGYWTIGVLEAADKASVIKELKDSREKVDFVKTLTKNIGKRGADASVSLLRLTDMSFALIMSIITSAFLGETAIQYGLVDGKRYKLTERIEMACEDIGEEWEKLVKERMKEVFQ